MSLASRLKHLERAAVAAGWPGLSRPICPRCGREIVARAGTAGDEEMDAHIFRRLTHATLTEIDALYNRVKSILPADACGECVVDAMSASEEGLRTCMRFNAEASAARDGTMAPVGGTTGW